MAKKRANGDGSIRKRSNGTWEARWTTPDGKRKSIYGDSQAAVRKKLTEFQAAADKGHYLEPTKLTVSEWLEEWFANYLDVKPSTLERYKLDARLHICPTLGQIQLSKLTTPMIQRLYRQKQNEGLSLKSIKNLHGVIHSALKEAVKMGYIPINISEACTVKTPPRPVKHPLKDDDVGRFLEAIKGTANEDLFYFITFTGLREAEAIGLTWDCIDFASSTIRVYRQWCRDRTTGRGVFYHFSHLKNGKPREFKIAPQVLDRLKQIKKHQAEWRLLMGAEWQNEYGFVFTHPNGRPLNAVTVYKNLKRVVRKLGLPNTTVHDLRHTFATISIQTGTDIKTVSAALGHATTAFTMDVYGHVTAAMQNDSAQRMEQFISNL